MASTSRASGLPAWIPISNTLDPIAVLQSCLIYLHDNEPQFRAAEGNDPEGMRELHGRLRVSTSTYGADFPGRLANHVNDAIAAAGTPLALRPLAQGISDAIAPIAPAALRDHYVRAGRLDENNSVTMGRGDLFPVTGRRYPGLPSLPGRQTLPQAVAADRTDHFMVAPAHIAEGISVRLDFTLLPHPQTGLLSNPLALANQILPRIAIIDPVSTDEYRAARRAVANGTFASLDTNGLRVRIRSAFEKLEDDPLDVIILPEYVATGLVEHITSSWEQRRRYDEQNLALPLLIPGTYWYRDGTASINATRPFAEDKLQRYQFAEIYKATPVEQRTDDLLTRGEDVTPRPQELRVFVSDHGAKFAVAICRDALTSEVRRVLDTLAIDALFIPALTITPPFEALGHTLAASNATRTVVANVRFGHVIAGPAIQDGDEPPARDGAPFVARNRPPGPTITKLSQGEPHQPWRLEVTRL